MRRCLLLFELGVLLAEAVDAARRVEEALLAGEEGMQAEQTSTCTCSPLVESTSSVLPQAQVMVALYTVGWMSFFMINLVYGNGASR